MKNNISLFPMLTESLRDTIKVSFSRYNFYYKVNNAIYDLDSELIRGSDKLHELIDVQLNSWNKEKNNICFTRTCKIGDCNSLFGPAGIATSDSKLGIALTWFSSDSKQRGVKPVVEFTSNDKEVEANIEFESDNGQFRGLVNFQTIIYLSQFGSATEDEAHLATVPGTILGELDNKFMIELDGTGSFFPIYDYAATKTSPLWNVTCDWTDPSHDKFVEKVQININTNHTNYAHLRDDNHQLLIEVISSALELIILKLQSNSEQWRLLEEEDFEPGSVLDAVSYFINNLEWDINNPEGLSSSIRLFLERRMGVL